MTDKLHIHPLSAYLAASEMGEDAFASLCGVTLVQLRGVLSGDFVVTPDEARRMSMATEGSVPPEAFMSERVFLWRRQLVVQIDLSRLHEAISAVFSSDLTIPAAQFSAFVTAATEAVDHTAQALALDGVCLHPAAMSRALTLVLEEILAEFPDHDLPQVSTLSEGVLSAYRQSA